MTIEQVKKAEKIGDVFTVEEFMDDVGCGFLPFDGSGVLFSKKMLKSQVAGTEQTEAFGQF